MNKIIFGLIVLVGVIAIGGYYYPEYVVKAGNPSGATFNTAKTAMIVWTPSTTAATTTSLFNGDGSDRAIKQVQYECTSLAAVNNPNFISLGWAFTAATTSVSQTGGLMGNTNYILNTSVATTVPNLFVSSTTPGAIGTAINRIWPNGTYLTFAANASSTATCIIGVDYIPGS